MSRSDGASYEINGHLVPSRLAMREANEWRATQGLPKLWEISHWYDEEKARPKGLAPCDNLMSVPHVCPFLAKVHGDTSMLCKCCTNCVGNCADEM